MASIISPLAPPSYPSMPPIAGVRLATGQAGIKYKNRTDVLLAAFDEGTEVAGVFTRSQCPSAAVDWCKAHLAGGAARALLVNSGNANAFTGAKGKAAVARSAALAAHALEVREDEVFLASTGVIGEPLDAEKFVPVIPAMRGQLAADGWMEAARAILTTDTFPKLATCKAELEGIPVTLNGFAKGAGMIAPDMATMLAFLFTDAPLAAPVLQALLARHVETTFNAITVDSDTSTSDTLLLFATGKAAVRGAPRIDRPDDPRLASFEKALATVLRTLAHFVVRDGEGARKFIEVCVTGAADDRSARRIAFSIANSPLVKTAIAGGDANWGRIVMAVGKAGEPADRDRLSIWFGNVRVADAGARDATYSEETVSRLMQQEEILITVDLGLGSGRATVWTCDLTKEYVAINGDYRS